MALIRRPFFTDPGARQQLNLNDNQFNSLNRAYQDAYGRYNNNLRGLNSNLNEQQRMQQMQQYQNQFQSDFGKSLDSTLTDRRARTRYDQLNRQFMGFNAFNDAGIQQQLNLTPQQRQQLQRMAGDWRRQLQTGRGNAGLTQEQWSQMSSQYWDQLNTVLTPQQRQSWSQATGERYSFSPNLYQQDENNLGDGNTSGNVGVDEGKRGRGSRCAARRYAARQSTPNRDGRCSTARKPKSDRYRQRDASRQLGQFRRRDGNDSVMCNCPIFLSHVAAEGEARRAKAWGDGRVVVGVLATRERRLFFAHWK